MKSTNEITKAEEALKHATTYLKPVLGIIGAWPIPLTSSFCSKVTQKVEQIITYTIFFLLLAPSFLYIFHTEKDAKTRIRLLGSVVNSSIQACKYTILLCRSKEIQIGLDMIRRHWIDANEESRLIIRSKANVSRRLTLIIVVTLFSCGLSYRCILPFMREVVITPDNITIRPLPCPSNFIIFDTQPTPNYEIIFTLQILCGFVTYAGLTGACGICALLVLHTCSMLEILGKKMIDLGNQINVSEIVVKQKIVDIVEYQNEIKIFFKNAKNITEYICFFDLLGGTIFICTTGYYVLMDVDAERTTSAIITFFLQLTFTFIVFKMCYIGQLLINENEHLEQITCTMKWYHLSYKQARYMVLIIAMSYYPMELTAGKTLSMSLTTFTDVLKLAFGYMRILRDCA